MRFSRNTSSLLASLLLAIAGCTSAESRALKTTEDIYGSWESTNFRLRFTDRGEFDGKELPAGADVMGKYEVTGAKGDHLLLSRTNTSLDGDWHIDLEGFAVTGGSKVLRMHREGQKPLELRRTGAR